MKINKVKIKARKYSLLNSSKKIRNKASGKVELYSFKPREKLQNCTWKFTLGDVDDYPSVPHAHAIENGYRLNAWTGEIYPKGKERRKAIGHLSKKEFKILHSDFRFREFAQKQIYWYRETYPDVSFYVPDWFEPKTLKFSSKILRNDSVIKSFIFRGSFIPNTEESRCFIRIQRK